MTLTTRLSLFFLAMLAIVLTGFSVTLYFLARDSFFHESEEHLDGALNALAGAADSESDGVLWFPVRQNRSLTSAIETWGQLVWVIRDEHEQIIDRSAQAFAADFPVTKLRHSSSTPIENETLSWQGGNWLVRQIQLTPQWKEAGKRESLSAAAIPEAQKHFALFITAAVSLQPVENTLLRLAVMLIGLSVAIWLAALFLGRALCRRALLPLSHMATAAGNINAAALERRLPLSSARDELHDLGEAFNSLLDRLHESFERQRRFTSDASHQLRTPLAAILGQTEVALRRDRSAEEYHRVLGSVHQEAEHLRKMTESLLYLARADCESVVPDMESVDLNEWLRQNLRTWENHPRYQDIVLEPPESSECQCNLHPVLAGELINVLLDNACKYSAPGTPVRLRIHRDGKTIQLQIQDQGVGIDDHDKKKIFEPFYRAPQQRERAVDGLGLGLSIAKRLTAAFGGDLTVTSCAPVGSCFTVSLPAANGCSAQGNAI